MDSIDDDFAFYDAIEQGNTIIVRKMITKGIDIHSNNERPLRLSIEKGHKEIEELLIQNGAILPDENPSWLIFPSLKQMRANGVLTNVQLLERKYKYSLIGRPIKTQKDIFDNLIEILSLNNSELLEKYIKYYDITELPEDILYEYIIKECINNSAMNYILTLIDPCDYFHLDDLYYVIRRGFIDIVKYFINHEEISKKIILDSHLIELIIESTEAIVAIEIIEMFHGHQDVVNEIVTQAIRSGNKIDIVKYFINNAELDSKLIKIIIKKLDCRTVIEIIKLPIKLYTTNQIITQAIRRNKLEIIKHFMYKEYTQKALWSAVYFGHLDIVKYLISLGVLYRYKDEKALRLALRSNRDNVAFFLMLKGADYNVALKYCCNKNYFKCKSIVQDFINKKDSLSENIFCGICFDENVSTYWFKCKTCNNSVHTECQEKWGKKCIYCRN